MKAYTYPVHELFYTFQGEGCFMGQPAFFIRLFGCPVHCPWCDSAGTWHPNWVPRHIERRTPEQLGNMVTQHGIDRVIVTGGEPAIHDLLPLTEEMHNRGIKVHLETSGAYEIRDGYCTAESNPVDWITVSPKKWALPRQDALLRADELKFIIESHEDIAFYYELYAHARLSEGITLPPRQKPVIWLHPEWSKRNDYNVLNAITTAVKDGHGLFRAGWQIHKQYQADALDPNSRALTPLGGDPAKGY